MDVGQNVRCTAGNLVKGDPLQTRQAKLPRARQHGKDFGKLIIGSEAEIKLVVGEDHGRLIPPDHLKMHFTRHPTTTAMQSPALWNKGRIVTSAIVSALTQ